MIQMTNSQNVILQMTQVESISCQEKLDEAGCVFRFEVHHN